MIFRKVGVCPPSPSDDDDGPGNGQYWDGEQKCRKDNVG